MGKSTVRMEWQLPHTSECILDIPGDGSETGVCDGVGLCPGGKKCEVGESLLGTLSGPLKK
jgi:hypothetical protein